MSTHKHIDRICCAALALAIVLTLLFVNGEALGLQAASLSMGYETRLFDTSRVHTIDIVMDDWDGFIDTCENEEYQVCSLVIDGEAYRNVAIRAKGNTSLTSVAAYGNDRYSFKIEFDHYDSASSYYGLDKLNLNNIIQDNTYMKDFLTYQLMGQFGVASPLCSYAYITVNGEEWGLYLAVEGLEDGFLQRSYGSGSGELYKPDSTSFGGGRGNGRDFAPEDLEDFFGGGDALWQERYDGGAQMPDGIGQPQDRGGDTDSPGGLSTEGTPSLPQDRELPDSLPGSQAEGPSGPLSAGGSGGVMDGGMGSSDVKLQYIDDDPDSYANIFDNAKTDVTDADKARLIASLKTLSSGEDIESVVDIEQVIRYFVVHTFVCNGDSYTGSMIHNYYLYEEDGVLSMLPWDYNLAFGGFQATPDASSVVNEPIDSPVSGGSLEDRPMIAWIFADETYTQLYHEYYREFLSLFFDSGCVSALIDSTSDMIAPYVEKDPTKFCTYEEFETGAAVLKAFCLLRAESVSGQLEGTIPSTSEGQAADASALVDASGITISDMGSMNNGGGFSGVRGGDADAAPAMGELGALPDRDGQKPAQSGEQGSLGQGPVDSGQQPEAGRVQPGSEASSALPAAAGDGGWGLLVLSAVVLLAGLLIAFRFKR